MVDIFVFCTDVEIVFSSIIEQYKESVRDIVRVLGDKVTRELIPRLMRVEFKFMPRWLHKKVNRVVMDLWYEAKRK